MATDNSIQGVDTSEQEEILSQLKKDLTPLPIKIKNYLNSSGVWIFLIAMLLMVLLIPMFSPVIEFVIILTYILYRKNIGAEEKLPFKKNQSSFAKYDLNELHPATNKPMAPAGITFFGNERGTKKEVWFSNSDVRTHCLIFGTTGAGKTETLLSICVNSLNQASGFIYVDGKGDNSLWVKVFSLVASKGRLDDIYVINFMTAHLDGYEKTVEKSSNTLNPCASSSAATLGELFVSLLPDSGGDGMWQGRASIFISSLLKPLVYLRDHGKLLLDVDTIRKYFTFAKVEELSMREDIPIQFRDGLVQYVENLPGYVKPTPDNPNVEQESTVGEQHGYITMQFTETFGLLADNLGHIMKTQIAEVDFYDIVINRRILVVLLPALEKSKQSLGNLGRIIVASIKNMMSTTLGTRVEGDREVTVDMRPTNARSPYMTVFDEYGYYAVKGAAVMPAQARSLGFFMIFAGQDYQAFKAGSEDDAGSIIANCAIKICMKLEDPTTTFEIFQKAAGQGKVAEIQSYEKDTKAMNESYGASKNVSISSKDIINVSDLRNQNAGESHMLFRKETKRLKHFYADPKLLKQSYLNNFLEVPPPDYSVANNFYNGEKNMFKKFDEILENFDAYKNQIRRTLNAIPSAKEELDTAFKFLNKANQQNDKQLAAAFCIIGYSERIDIVNDQIVTEVRDNLNKFNEYNKDEEDINSGIVDIEVEDKEIDMTDSYKDLDHSETDINFEDSDNTMDKLKEKIKQKNKIIKDDSYTYDLFEALNLDYLNIKDKLSQMENELNGKNYMNGLIGDREMVSETYSNHTAENNLLDLAINTKIKKQKPRSDKEIDNIINELLNEDLADL